MAAEWLRSGCEWLRVAASGFEWLRVAASGREWLPSACRVAAGCRQKLMRAQVDGWWLTKVNHTVHYESEDEGGRFSKEEEEESRSSSQ